MTRGVKPVIGLVGGIGAGKSQVAAVFAQCGCAVICSDRLNHEVLNTPDVLATLQAWWGPDVVTAGGTADRSRIAAIVFQAPAERQRLERLVYPLIAEKRAAIMRLVETDSAIKAIVLDSPLLFESNLDRECDSIVYVDAPEAVRLARLQQERGWDRSEMRRRENQQLPLEEKRRRSEYVVDNCGTVKALHPQVSNILEKILGATGVSD